MDYGNERYRDDKYYDDYGNQYDSNRGQGNSYDQYPPSGGSRRDQDQYGGRQQQYGDPENAYPQNPRRPPVVAQPVGKRQRLLMLLGCIIPNLVFAGIFIFFILYFIGFIKF